ncbi:hypothetical protein Caci_3124 [Catenulispora acidiphila DSM 44928]|uniref:Uncharacterized protein n=1 Tax=Catenulispora acidiphila (strain DSM 44928 / JCM 14897 / NBRC 102108 / NRRL B-24433 / ID139908) TaxID=479433 RepID=C7Q4R4_CATAD|nr:hypothetical protein Caci_3124 [Catenulispora acidiphila DSM 44928]
MRDRAMRDAMARGAAVPGAAVRMSAGALSVAEGSVRWAQHFSASGHERVLRLRRPPLTNAGMAGAMTEAGTSETGLTETGMTEMTWRAS